MCIVLHEIDFLLLMDSKSLLSWRLAPICILQKYSELAFRRKIFKLLFTVELTVLSNPLCQILTFHSVVS